MEGAEKNLGNLGIVHWKKAIEKNVWLMVHSVGRVAAPRETKEYERTLSHGAVYVALYEIIYSGT